MATWYQTSARGWVRGRRHQGIEFLRWLVKKYQLVYLMLMRIHTFDTTHFVVSGCWFPRIASRDLGKDRWNDFINVLRHIINPWLHWVCRWRRSRRQRFLNGMKITLFVPEQSELMERYVLLYLDWNVVCEWKFSVSKSYHVHYPDLCNCVTGYSTLASPYVTWLCCSYLRGILTTITHTSSITTFLLSFPLLLNQVSGTFYPWRFCPSSPQLYSCRWSPFTEGSRC